MLGIFAHKEHLFWMSILILIVFGGYCSGTQGYLRYEDADEKDKYLALFQEAYHHVKTLYPDKKKLKTKSLYYGAIRGAFKSLGDPHSVFLDEKFFAILKGQMSGSFAGVGFSIMENEGKIVILYTLPNSPARRAGIKPRDILIKINGKSIKNWSLYRVISKLRGRANTKVKLSILRGRQQLEKVMRRKRLKQTEVEFKILKNRIAYLTLKQFSNLSALTVRRALLKLKKKKIKGLIFDLRGNTGGNLFSCLYIVNYFLEGDKRLVYIRKSLNDAGEFHVSDSRISIFTEIPLVVLSDGLSASASEIFIGAIQDHRRGIIVGTKSFGKGSVQTYNKAKTYSKTGFKVTISKWFTPKGRAIDQKGLKPDIEIKEPELTIDEKYNVVKLIKSKLIERYVLKHPKIGKKEINRFSRLLRKKRIKLKKRIIIKLLKREEYLYTETLIVDMNYDRPLIKGWEYINKQIP